MAAVAFRPHGSSEPTRAAAAEGDADSAKGGEAVAEGEDPEAEAEAHVGVPVTKAGQSSITAAEARAMAPAVTAPGWAGEIKLGVEDTWEPTIAADPSAPYVYAMYNRFGGPKACKQCPGDPDVRARLERQRRQLGPRDLSLSMPGSEVAVRPGLQGGVQRRGSTPRS